MSDYIDTREGWRRLDPYEETHRPQQRTLTEHDADGKFIAYWVREEPVPSLPTEPGYYRAEAPQYGGTVVVELLNSPAGQWVDSGDREYLTPEDVRALGPLVLLEPRAETAEAVVRRMSELLTTGGDKWVGHVETHIAREFGVML